MSDFDQAISLLFQMLDELRVHDDTLSHVTDPALLERVYAFLREHQLDRIVYEEASTSYLASWILGSYLLKEIP